MTKEQRYLVNRLAKMLKLMKWTLVTAESCTAGALAYTFSCSPNASPLLERGFIVYSKESKIQTLHVKTNSLKKYGAVSSQVVKEMAEGALKYSKANLSIAITGLAGPEGDETNTPVGTIWFGLAFRRRKTVTQVMIFKGSRNNILKKCVVHALKLAIEYMQK